MSNAINKLWMLVLALLPASAFAEEGAEAMHAAASSWGVPVAAGLGIAIAVIAAATAQGRVAAAFLEGVSRNPGAQKSMFVPLILGLAFVETLVLFTFVVQLMVLGKI